jgi:hypothetical protein
MKCDLDRRRAQDAAPAPPGPRCQPGRFGRLAGLVGMLTLISILPASAGSVNLTTTPSLDERAPKADSSGRAV